MDPRSPRAARSPAPAPVRVALALALASPFAAAAQQPTVARAQDAAGQAPAAATSVEAAANRTMSDLVSLLVRRGKVTPWEAERLVPDGAGTKAIPDLARYLGRALVTPAELDEIDGALAAGGPGAGSRALSELVRALFAHGVLNDGDVEALLSPDGVRRVTYVSELAKAQLREQVRREVVEELKRDGWGAPNASPEWVRRLRLSADLRFRYERILYPARNAPVVDFNAINTGSPVNFNLANLVDFTNDRYVNVDQDRARPRLRARVGLDADLPEGLAAGVRVATGDSSSPVSTNQTLGASGGNFSKYQLWLDRAWVRLDRSRPDGTGVVASIGRFENPFLSTDLVWDEDVSFDGLVAKGTVAVGKTRLFLTGGAFPLFTTAVDFPPEQAAKFTSRDRWLYAVQGGVDWRPTERVTVKIAAAYDHFQGVQGRASSPCDTHLKGVSCDTDAMRPSFAQKGNTYFPLRTPSAEALAQEALNPLTTPRYEYFGLATRFQVATLTARLESRMEDVRLALDGEGAWNVGFDRAAVEKIAVNNFGSCTAGVCDRYVGGDRAGLARISVGTTTVARRWGWSAAFTYRYVETDALLDAFTDSDLGLGGTNLKGFGIAGSLGLAAGVVTSVRWLSGDAVSGSPYSVDVLQIDLTARF
jgi:hypothetical protein